MDRTLEPRPQFGMTSALVVSAILHALLVAISLWLPATGAKVVAKNVEDEVLHFTFAQPAADAADARPRGDVPFETPRAQPPARPAPQEQTAEPDHQPEGRPSLAPPSSAAADQPQRAVEESRLREPPPPETHETEATNEDRPDEDLLEALPEDAGGDRRRGEDERSAQGGSVPPALSPDVGRRLQEFGEALARARAAQPEQQQSPRTSRNVFTPDSSAFPSTGFGAGNLVFESRDYDWTDYARQIYTAIWRAWHQRLYVTTDDFEKWAYQNQIWMLEHYSRVGFVIQRSGQVTGIVLEGPSGCVPLDDSALDALAEVILPPLPADFPRDSETVHATFIAVGQINSMRPVLTQLKRLGYF